MAGQIETYEDLCAKTRHEIPYKEAHANGYAAGLEAAAVYLDEVAAAATIDSASTGAARALGKEPQERPMSEKEDAKLAADVEKALDALKAALKAASDAGMKTYVHGDGSFEECDLTVEVAREYTF